MAYTSVGSWFLLWDSFCNGSQSFDFGLIFDSFGRFVFKVVKVEFFDGFFRGFFFAAW